MPSAFHSDATWQCSFDPSVDVTGTENKQQFAPLLSCVPFLFPNQKVAAILIKICCFELGLIVVTGANFWYERVVADELEFDCESDCRAEVHLPLLLQ